MKNEEINKDNLTKDVGITAEPAEAEESLKAAAVPEKFKDVQTLVKAYTDLQAEFTRRSQRLKELEKGNKADSAPDAARETSSRKDEEELIKSALSNAKVRDAVIAEYLKGIDGGKVPLIFGGGAVAAPRVAPKSVKEAGRLAQEYLKK